MAAGHGGARVGAGRPKGSKDKAEKPPTGRIYADALEYLEAVVRGEEPADGLRIAAARVVLPFQKPKARAPVESPPPKAMRAAQERTQEKGTTDDWNKRAAAVRERMRKKHES